MELETTRQNCEDNMEQTVLSERERFTQMQWDLEELRGKCLELELQLNSEKVCFSTVSIYLRSYCIIEATVVMPGNAAGGENAFRVNKNIYNL